MSGLELPGRLYKSYGLRRPRTVQFWRQGTCEEYGCPHWRDGWVTRVPADSPQARYVRQKSGRQFTEAVAPGGVVEFRFPSGQTCFAAGTHRVPIEREPLLVVRGGRPGDYTGERRLHARSADWVDDFQTHLDKVRTDQERG